jgi:hypothetical protein
MQQRFIEGINLKNFVEAILKRTISFYEQTRACAALDNIFLFFN